MLESLEHSDVNQIKMHIAKQINELGISAAEKRGQDCSFEYGRIAGLIYAFGLIISAQKGEL